eukprot:226347-Chlamydomonas_euryale.AAC.1
MLPAPASCQQRSPLAPLLPLFLSSLLTCSPAHPLTCSPLLSPAPPCSHLLSPAPPCSPLLSPAPLCSPLLSPALTCSPAHKPYAHATPTIDAAPLSARFSFPFCYAHGHVCRAGQQRAAGAVSIALGSSVLRGCLSLTVYVAADAGPDGANAALAAIEAMLDVGALPSPGGGSGADDSGGEGEGEGPDALRPDPYLAPVVLPQPLRPTVVLVVVPALPRGCYVEVEPVLVDVGALEQRFHADPADGATSSDDETEGKACEHDKQTQRGNADAGARASSGDGRGGG